MISVPQLEAIVGPVALASPPRRRGAASPGMLDRHYSPRAKLVLVDAGRDIRARRERASERRVGARRRAPLAITSRRRCATHDAGDAAGYAARLYDALHALDDAGCDVIIVERVPADARNGSACATAWSAPRDVTP